MKTTDQESLDKVCLSGSPFTLINGRSCTPQKNPTGRLIRLFGQKSETNKKMHQLASRIVIIKKATLMVSLASLIFLVGCEEEPKGVYKAKEHSMDRVYNELVYDFKSDGTVLQSVRMMDDTGKTLGQVIRTSGTWRVKKGVVTCTMDFELEPIEQVFEFDNNNLIREDMPNLILEKQ